MKTRRCNSSQNVKSSNFQSKLSCKMEKFQPTLWLLSRLAVLKNDLKKDDLIMKALLSINSSLANYWVTKYLAIILASSIGRMQAERKKAEPFAFIGSKLHTIEVTSRLLQTPENRVVDGMFLSDRK